MQIIRSCNITEIKNFIDPESKFFTRGNMRFFAAKNYSGYRVDTGNPESHAMVFIISTKKSFDDYTRAFTIKVISKYHGNIKTYGDFCQFKSLQDARLAAKQAIATGDIIKQSI